MATYEADIDQIAPGIYQNAESEQIFEVDIDQMAPAVYQSKEVDVVKPWPFGTILFSPKFNFYNR